MAGGVRPILSAKVYLLLSVGAIALIPQAAIAGPITAAFSQAIAPPATKLKSGTLVTPDAARTFYGSATTHTAGLSLSAGTSPEIVAVAKSLRGTLNVTTTSGRDAFAQRVADYIRNGIATEFRYGLSKGGRGAMIDQSGTPFDQAELMVLLLREEGVTANFVMGDATLTAAQFGKWTGLVTGLSESAQTFTVSAVAACQMLADGGIPATVNGASTCTGLTGNLSTVVMSHIWVQVGGINYDPSYKVSTLHNGIDLPAAMGCGTAAASTCGATLSAAGMTGASQSTTSSGIPYVANYNLDAAKTANTALKASLASYIKTQNINGQGVNASVYDVLGGKQLDPQTGSYAPLSYSAKATWTGSIPNQYRTKLSVKTQLSCGAFYADEIAGRALLYEQHIQGDGYGFYVDNKATSTLSYVAAGGCNAAAAPYVLIAVDHPYAAQNGAYADDAVNFKLVDPPADETGFSRRATSNMLYFEGGAGVVPRQYVAGKQKATDYPEQNYLSNSSLMIVHGFGEQGMSAQRHMADLASVTDQSDHKCGVMTSGDLGFRRCDYNQEAVVAETFGSMRTLAGHLVDGVAKAITTRHHDIGVVYAGRAPGLSIMSTQESLSITPMNGAASVRQSAFDMSSLVLAEAESRAAAIATAPGISAARAFFFKEWDNSLYGKAGRIYDIIPSKMASYVAALPKQASVTSGGTTSYGSYCINYVSAMGVSGGQGCWRHLALQDVANQGYSTLIMEGSQGELFYNGTGERALTMWEYVKGGTNIGDAYSAAIKSTEVIDQGALRKKFLGVDPSSGNVTFSPGPDLVTGTGDFPYSLPFTRTFAGTFKEKGTNTTTYYWNDSSPGPTPVESGVAASSGPDALYHDRLGGGWVHNYQVRLHYTNDLAYQLGSENAYFASDLLADLQIVKDLGLTGTLPNKIGAMFAINDMRRTIPGYAGGTYNTITVNKGASSISFHQMYDQSWFSAKEPSAKLEWTPTPKYTSPEGDIITFSPYRIDDAVLNSNGNTLVGDVSTYGDYNIFKADTWTFPSGVKVTFNYAPYALSTPPGCIPGTAPLQYTGQYGYLLTSVTNNLGRSLTFAYDNQWIRQTTTVPCGPDYDTGVWYPGYVYQPVKFLTYRLKKVTDENGRSVSFAYGNDAIGDEPTTLDYFTMTDPANKVTRYEYTAGTDSPDPATIIRNDFQLRRWFSPLNATTPYQRIAYDGLFRASKVTDRNGNTISYYSSNLAPSERWKYAQIVDGTGGVTTQEFDDASNNIASIDPLGHEATRRFDRSAHLVRLVNPEGNAEERSYDFRGNLTKTCLIGKARAGQPCSDTTDIVTKSTYVEGPTVVACSNLTTCNKVASETDARGYVTNYSWNATTGLLTKILAPAIYSTDDSTNVRPETDAAYTSYNGLYLLTSKTQKISSSHSLVTSYEYNSSNHYTLKSVITDSAGLALRTCLKFDAYGNLISKTDPNANLSSCP